MANEPMDPETRKKLAALKKRRGLGRSLGEILEEQEPSEVLGKTLFADTSSDFDTLCESLANSITTELSDETLEFGQAEEYGEGTSLMSTRVKSIRFLPYFEKVTCEDIKKLDNAEELVQKKDIPMIVQQLGLTGILEVVFWKWGSIGHYGPSGNFPYSEFYLCKLQKVASVGSKVLDWERDYGYSQISKGQPPEGHEERKLIRKSRDSFADEAAQFGVNIRSRSRK
jgi:hypothetical protein